MIENLADRALSLDATWLITAALLVRADGLTRIVDDPLGKALDVIGVNEYIGRYEAHPDTANITQWSIVSDKPLIISELWRRRESRLAWRRESPMDRGVSGKYFPAPVAHAQPYPSAKKNESLGMLMDFVRRIEYSQGFRTISIAKDLFPGRNRRRWHFIFSRGMQGIERWNTE